MNTTPKLDAARARYRAIERAIPVYWQDAIEALIRAPWVTAAGLARPGRVGVRGSILAILEHPAAGLRVLIPARNIVTNDGDLYYAQRSLAETPTDDFLAAGAGIRLGDTNTPTPGKADTDVNNFIAGSALAIFAGYPQTNDPDGRNTGAGVDVATWQYRYSTGNTFTNVIEGAIVDVRAGPTTAALSHWLFAAQFSVTADDTLDVIVNHEFLGV